ncbi:hypothetical protein AAHB47_31140 [Bacillus wiedmannii]
MSKIDSLLKRARKLQADRIPTSKVHIVSDSEQIEEIPPEKKQERTFILLVVLVRNVILVINTIENVNVMQETTEQLQR